MSPELRTIRRERARMLAESLSHETGIPVADILGKSRDPEVVAARHRLWTLLRDSGLSYTAVAASVGVDHTTVIYAVKKASGCKKVRVA